MVRRSTPAKLEAEKRFPIRLRIAVPCQGFGSQLNRMHDWLDRRVGKENYAVHGGTLPGLPEASFWYFDDMATAREFVERFSCRLAVIERTADEK